MYAPELGHSGNKLVTGVVTKFKGAGLQQI